MRAVLNGLLNIARFGRSANQVDGAATGRACLSQYCPGIFHVAHDSATVYDYEMIIRQLIL